jgi:hypothetical protein
MSISLMTSGASAVFLWLLVVTTDARAEIRSITIDERQHLAEDARRGAPAYQKLRGRLVGEVDPLEPRNAIIQDIAFAPRNGSGKVEYVTTFTLLMPDDAAKANRVLLVEVPNRGRRLTPFGSDEEALGFLRARLYSVLWVGWQGDLPEQADAARPASSLQLESLRVPRAMARNGAALTGVYLVRVPAGAASGPSGNIMKLDQGAAGPLAYFPATYDTRRAMLTGGAPEGMDGRPIQSRYTIPPSAWEWWNCAANAPGYTAKVPAELCVKRIKGTFSADETYMLVFTARDPLVLGLGLAATRDAVSFFRSAPARANPLANAVDHVIGQGVSQAGNFVKTFIALGFDVDESGRRVWDGANAHIAGRKVPINYRFATPGSSPTLYLPGNEGVLWWSDAQGPDGGRKRSMLNRCQETNSCPRIFETFGGAELWNQRMTSGLVTFDLTRDIALPANVRRYFFPGTTHGGGRGGFPLDSASAADRGPCALAPNPNPQDAQMRALLVALTEWAVRGVEPPASRYPTISRGELVHDTRGIANPTLVYDYGWSFNHSEMSGVISRMPAPIRRVIPALVPQVNADGNEISGAPSVQMRAPLGTYLSWNLYREGVYAGRICSSSGSFVPFAKTRAQRLASGDERPSVEERYGSRAGYLAAVSTAIGRSVRERLLLPEDGARLLEEARAATETGDLSFLPE